MVYLIHEGPVKGQNVSNNKTLLGIDFVVSENIHTPPIEVFF